MLYKFSFYSMLGVYKQVELFDAYMLSTTADGNW